MSAASDYVSHIVAKMNAAYPSITWAAGVNVFAGPPQPAGRVPIVSIWVAHVSSPDAIYLKDGGTLTSSRLKVFLRIPSMVSPAGGGVGGHAAGETIGDKLFKSLDRNPATSYYECSGLNSSLALLEADPQGHMLFVCDFLAEKRTYTTSQFIYAGSTVNAAVDTEAEVLALLQEDEVDIVNGAVVALNLTAGQYGYIVTPESEGISTYTVNGFVGGFVTIATGVNVSGVLCKVARTLYTSLGSVNVRLST